MNKTITRTYIQHCKKINYNACSGDNFLHGELFSNKISKLYEYCMECH